MKITWLGHSGFRIEIEEAVLLVDPWLTGNPMFPMDRRAEAIQGATHILLTHGHGDHIGDAVAIAKELDIEIAGIYDLVGFLAGRDGVKIIGFNKGGTIRPRRGTGDAGQCQPLVFGRGRHCGVRGRVHDRRRGHVIYLSGDTDIMADMDWMGDYHKPDIGILSCGGHFTMDMKRAAYAAKRYFNFTTVIPCHYRTFPLLEQSADVLKSGLPA